MYGRLALLMMMQVAPNGRSLALHFDNGEPQLGEKKAPEKNLAPSDGEEETSL